MKRNSFIFYLSYYDAIKNLPEEEQGQMYKIIIEYMLLGKQPKKMNSVIKTCFLLTKPYLDIAISKYENGLKGGRPKKENEQLKNQTETKSKPNQNQTETKSKPKANRDESNINMNININNNINKQDKTKQVNRIEEKNNLTDNIVQSSPDKKQYFLDVVNEKIKKLSDNNIEDIQIINRLKYLIEQISKMTSCVVNGQQTESTTILEALVDLFIGTDNEIIDRIANIFETIDASKNIFNKFKYSVGVLYNQARQVISKC